MKKIRLFANRDRVTRTRIVYITLIAGTVLIAFLLVLLNRWIFRLSEAGLYDKTEYEAVSIISADSIGAPLSLETRVGLFLQCERQGDERAVMPGELDNAAITETLSALWNDTLEVHAKNGVLPTGESVGTVFRKSRYTAVLRDFYNEQSGAKLALWCAQAYYSEGGGNLYCLSVQFDSRTGEVYSENCALYDCLSPDGANAAFLPFLRAHGYAESLAEKASITFGANGCTGTLKLPDGLTLYLNYRSGEQYDLLFR